MEASALLLHCVWRRRLGIAGQGWGGGLERSREVGSQAVYAMCQGLSCWPLTQAFSLWAMKRVALGNLEPTDSWTVLFPLAEGEKGGTACVSPAVWRWSLAFFPYRCKQARVVFKRGAGAHLPCGPSLPPSPPSSPVVEPGTRAKGCLAGKGRSRQGVPGRGAPSAPQCPLPVSPQGPPQQAVLRSVSLCTRRLHFSFALGAGSKLFSQCLPPGLAWR